MKLFDIIKKVGGGIISTVVPGGGLILGAVNALLPSDQQLPNNATGADVGVAMAGLTPSDRLKLEAKEFDVDIAQIKESHSTVRTMLEADNANPHSTRPRIALGAFYVIAFAVVVAVGAWAYGVVTGDAAMVKAVMGGWQFILAMIGPLVTLLWAYFGVLKTEHKNKLDAANGSATPSGIAGFLSSLISKK